MRRWREHWRELTAGSAALERWLLPAECLLCHEAAGPADALICDLCRRRWRPVSAPWCGRCGQPADDDLPCRLCAEWPEELERVRSAVWLEDGARQAVHALKYSGWWRVTAQLAQVMTGLEPLAGSVILVPVPLAPRRLRTRGYNQAERLAAALGERLGLRVDSEALARRRETPTQTALTSEERAANMAGAFLGKGIHGRNVVLVDDVLTTGATLGACAEALRKAGAARVEAVTFARARAVGDFG